MKRSTIDFPQIPDKIYFRIGEVSKLVGVDTHVLRYWETEFSIIKPFRGKSKQRLYRRQDVENLLRIKALLHDQGYTISGAKKLLKSHSRTTGEPGKIPPGTLTQNELPLLQLIKNELQGILTQLGPGKEVGS